MIWVALFLYLSGWAVFAISIFAAIDASNAVNADDNAVNDDDLSKVLIAILFASVWPLAFVFMVFFMAVKS